MLNVIEDLTLRFSCKNALILGLLAATMGNASVQALPSAETQLQPEPVSEPEIVTAFEMVATSVNQAQSVQQRILDLSNVARKDSGLNALRFSSQLNAAAQRHANDLASGAQFSHTGSDGSSMVDRVRDSGYQYWSIAENIYYQSPRNQPARAVQGWLKSPGHRRNLLNARFTDMGVGYATDGRNHYYVQVFGRPQ